MGNSYSFSLGKTAAFILPVLERLIYKPRQAPVTRVLVLVPTRELGIQVHSVTKQLAQFSSITTCLAVGEYEVGQVNCTAHCKLLHCCETGDCMVISGTLLVGVLWFKILVLILCHAFYLFVSEKEKVESLLIVNMVLI